MPYGIANQNGQVQGHEIAAILDLAWENGIDTLDTAKDYGTSEESIGNYLKNQSENSWKIITKISDSKQTITDQLQDSTKKLTVHPTSVLAHSAELFLDAAFQSELQEAKVKKLIRKTGVSLYSENEINQVLESDCKPDVIQLPLNILDTRLYHHGTLVQLADEGIEIHVRSAFLQGLFYLPESELNDRFSDAVPYLEKLKSIATEVGLSLAELSLLWLLVSLEEISKVVIGVDNASQLKAHLQTIEKNVDAGVFEEALSLHYENENILNPSLWPSKS
ncbi:aldo/keto reductase [candidate division KSB1 bacterium]|nr:aldo/keto reductase [candidate division KSB1 bacterium]